MFRFPFTSALVSSFFAYTLFVPVLALAAAPSLPDGIVPVQIAAQDVAANALSVSALGASNSAAENAAVMSKAVNAKQFQIDKKVKSTSGVSSLSVTDPAVAMLTIFSDPTATWYRSSGLNFDLGVHAFITVRNVTSGAIQIGNLSGIASGRTLSVGTWGNISEHIGLWYDVETLVINRDGAYGGRVSVSYIMTASQLNRLNSYIANHDSWSQNTNNCSSFASGAWNAIVEQTYQISAGIPNTPKNLANNLKSKFPSYYSTGAYVPYYYATYFAQGTGAPRFSNTRQWSNTW